MLVAVDTGGTKTLVASFSEDGTLGEQTKFATPPKQADYVEKLRELITEKYSDQEVEAIIIAMPGIVKEGVAVWCNNLRWKDFDVKSAMAGVLGDTPILVENDANLAGLSETRILKAMPRQSLYVTISTGIGTGIITDGHIDPALRLSEGGRSLVEFDGVVREWESFASGQAIHKAYSKYARDITSKQTWYQISDRISRGFLAIIPLLQPDIIIIGGSIGTYFDRFSSDLQGILRENLPPHIHCPTFVQAKYPEEAVIYGCYYYALDSLDNISA
ncbi:MAG TPA: ROK family protein [Candidatus Saccharibacteria bacterium]|nr:ROK family protein [Candidatus Saccharibacteria bacterium]HRQ97806.1 ROK family protein [Candidatus Saccharibacteria bacterium]